MGVQVKKEEEADGPTACKKAKTEEDGDKKEESKVEVKKEVSSGFEPILPDDDDKKDFKYGPYNPKMTLEECEVMEREEGPLSLQPGLGALAELRRIKWFQHVGLPTPYLPDICRLIRGLAIREPSWRSFRILCPWSIALIINVIINFEVAEAKKNAGSGPQL